MGEFVTTYDKPRNFKEDILSAARGEPIEAIVIGEMGWADFQEEGKPPWKHIMNQLISWEEAAPLLDYEYDVGFGAPDCQAIMAWTASRVIYVVQYDGSTRVIGVYRNPTAHEPLMPGG